MQLTADIFGLPTARPHLYEASGLGAAIDAAVGAGLHTDFSTAIAEMTRPGETFKPNPNAQTRYDDLYHNVYKQMYKKLSPLYKAMQRVR